MITLNTHELLELLAEDLPYNDLTSEAFGIAETMAELSLNTRGKELLICGVEEAVKLAELKNLEILEYKPSGTLINGEFFRARGDIADIEMVVKTIQNLLDFSSGISTYTYNFVKKAKAINPDIVIATTRKTIPFTKKLSIKSVIAGGGSIHRLNLSDSILLFDHHRAFIDIDLADAIKIAQMQNPEKKIAIEAENTQEAIEFAKMGADIIQLEKFPLDELTECVKKLRDNHKNIKIIATGGINISNISDFASSGADIIVTTAPYFAPPADIKVKIERL